MLSEKHNPERVGSLLALPRFSEVDTRSAFRTLRTGPIPAPGQQSVTTDGLGCRRHPTAGHVDDSDLDDATNKTVASKCNTCSHSARHRNGPKGKPLARVAPDARRCRKTARRPIRESCARGRHGKTIAINFSKSALVIDKGSAFLRLVFHPIEGAPSTIDPTLRRTTDQYSEEMRNTSKLFPVKFLNIPSVVNKLTSRVIADVTSRQTNLILLILTGATIAFMLWTHFEGVIARQAPQQMADTLAQRVDDTSDELGELRSRVAVLEAQRPAPVPAPRKPRR